MVKSILKKIKQLYLDVLILRFIAVDNLLLDISLNLHVYKQYGKRITNFGILQILLSFIYGFYLNYFLLAWKILLILLMIPSSFCQKKYSNIWYNLHRIEFDCDPRINRDIIKENIYQFNEIYICQTLPNSKSKKIQI